jgi:hypothetical protein
VVVRVKNRDKICAKQSRPLTFALVACMAFVWCMSACSSPSVESSPDLPILLDAHGMDTGEVDSMASDSGSDQVPVEDSLPDTMHDQASPQDVVDAMPDALAPLDSEDDVAATVDSASAILDDAELGDTTPVDTGDEPSDVVPDVPICETCGVSLVTAQMDMEPAALTSLPERTQHNPLRGFMTSYLWGQPANDLPDQMEFLYLPMSTLWDASGDTFDSGLEPLLQAAATRAHHVVLRVYIDYPSKPYGLPDYLQNMVGCSPYQDYGGGCSPNYDHPLLVEAMTGLLSAMGQIYDGDTRLGAVQIGLLGFWGEWHTYPHTEWFPSLGTQEAVLNAANDAFSITQIQVRRPAANSVGLRIGFHDDSFAHSTLGPIDWFFLPSLISAGADARWEEVMIGGEVRPELQSSIFADDYPLGTYAQDVLECIDQTHASYLLNYRAFSEDGTGYVGSELTLAKEAALTMGYRFELLEASLHLSNLEGDTVQGQVVLQVAQTGNAPFYYGLFPSLEVAGLGAPIVSDEDLRTLLPGETRELVFDLGKVPVNTVNGTFKVHLVSDILQANQQVLLATDTPWTEPNMATGLAWSVGCVVDGQEAMLGEAVGVDPSGCSCVCDVDGKLRNCAGALCP